MAKRAPAQSERKRPPCPEWLADIRKAFKRHRMGRPGWVVNEFRGRLRLLSHELPPRPDEPPSEDAAGKVRHLYLKTPPGPTTSGPAIFEVTAIFDAVMAGTWRWPDDPLQPLQPDHSQPLLPTTIAALAAALRLELVGEQLGEHTWDRTWAPYLKRLEEEASQCTWPTDAELLRSFLHNWPPDSRARQMAFDRARRVWKQAMRSWPEAVAGMRGSGKAAADPEGVRAFTDPEIVELRARIQRSAKLTASDLVAWDCLICFGLRPAELKGLALSVENGVLVASVRRVKRTSKGSTGPRTVPAVPPSGWPSDCYGLLDRFLSFGLPAGMVSAQSPGQCLTQQLRRLRDQSQIAAPIAQELTTYGLRHSFALRLGLELGLHVREAAELCGHSPQVHLNTYGRRLDTPKLHGRVAALLSQRSSS